MSEFNDIGISRQLNWPRSRKLLTIAASALLCVFCAAVAGFVLDFLPADADYADQSLCQGTDPVSEGKRGLFYADGHAGGGREMLSAIGRGSTP